MNTYTLNLKSDEGFGLVLYIEADSLGQAIRKVRLLNEDQPEVFFPGADDCIEARVFLYGDELAEHVEEWDL